MSDISEVKVSYSTNCENKTDSALGYGQTIFF